MNKLTRLVLIIGSISLSSCQPNFFKVVSSSYAKELCSCLFVVGQSEDYCKKYAKQIVSVSVLKILTEEKKIEAKGFGHTSSAVFQSKKMGCRLVN